MALVKEAGGWVSDFLAGDSLTKGNRLLATTPGLRQPLLEITST
jgi:myo-inositol-1(or 4)-monophosphatase